MVYGGKNEHRERFFSQFQCFLSSLPPPPAWLMLAHIKLQQSESKRATRQPKHTRAVQKKKKISNHTERERERKRSKNYFPFFHTSNFALLNVSKAHNRLFQINHTYRAFSRVICASSRFHISPFLRRLSHHTANIIESNNNRLRILLHT